LGKLAAQALVSVIESGDATDVTAPEPEFIARGSTSAAHSDPVEPAQQESVSLMP